MRQVAGLDWRIAGTLVVCLVLAAMAVTHSRQSASKYQGPGIKAEQKAERRLKGEQPAETASQIPRHQSIIADKIISGFPGRDGEHEAEHRNEEGAEFWPSVLGVRLKITDTLLVLLTLALAIYTRELNRSTLKLWEAGERQIELSKDSLQASRESIEAAKASAEQTRELFFAEQRPWIEVRYEIPEAYRIIEGNINFSIRFTFRNIGKSAALNVESYAHAFVPTNESSNVFDHFRSFCENRVGLCESQALGWGTDILPDQTHSLISWLIIPSDEVQASSAKWGGRIMPTIMVCCTYRGIGNDAVKYTPVLIRIHKRTATGIRSDDDIIRIAETELAPEVIQLRPMGTGNLTR